MLCLSFLLVHILLQAVCIQTKSNVQCLSLYNGLIFSVTFHFAILKKITNFVRTLLPINLAPLVFKFKYSNVDFIMYFPFTVMDRQIDAKIDRYTIVASKVY